MSNSFAIFIFGCEVPESAPDLRGEVEEEARATHQDERAGWHITYDQHEDNIWFGARIGSIQNGFGIVPSPSSVVVEAVLTTWTELDELTRGILGVPKFICLAGID